MKVRDAIALLQKENPESELVTPDDCGDFHPVTTFQRGTYTPINSEDGEFEAGVGVDGEHNAITMYW